MSVTNKVPAKSTMRAARPVRPEPLTLVLLAIIAVAVLAAAVAVGHMWGDSGSSSASGPSTSSVDAGFARDMSTHHRQAVTMAGYARDHSTSEPIKLMAYDIETLQDFQVGEMQGWLDAWGLSRIGGEPMAWTGEPVHGDSETPMPGMATTMEMREYQTMRGKDLDVRFLQLMIRHHQGGLPMAQYAAEHASQAYVRDLAQSMSTAQAKEIKEMQALLRTLGGTPLPAPTH